MHYRVHLLLLLSGIVLARDGGASQRSFSMWAIPHCQHALIRSAGSRPEPGGGADLFEVT